MHTHHTRHRSLESSRAKPLDLHPFAPTRIPIQTSNPAPTSPPSSTPRRRHSFEPLPASTSPSFLSNSTSRTKSQTSNNHDPPSPTSSNYSAAAAEEEEEEEFTSVPLSRHEASTESALFAPVSSLSRRKVEKFDHKFHREEERERRGGLRKFKAEMEVAIGLSHLFKEEKKEKKRRGGSVNASSFGGSRAGGEGKGIEEIEGLFKRVEGGLEKMIEGKDGQRQDRLAVSGDRKPSTLTTTTTTTTTSRRDSVTAEQVLVGAAGLAGVAGLVGAGYELYKKHEKEKRAKLGEELARPASAPVMSPTTSREQDFRRFDPSQTIPIPLSTLPPPSSSASSPPLIFISHLTPSQHKTLQHAAAALLLKHHERHLNSFSSNDSSSSGKGEEGETTFHYDEIGLIVGAVVGGWKEVTQLVEEGLGKVGFRKSNRLFGVDLKMLTKHEGVSSTHGIDPNAKGLRIPEFLDHLISALKQSDMSIPGILRKSGNIRQILQIIDALDHADGSNETVLDLAKLDPVTLANLFQRFLGALPHPVLTHHLFGLFVATSHIQHPGLRRRAMHLVICLMPKVNRDVMECVFLFLSWLSKHAHLSVIDGQALDLTGIANILLSPKNRQPHQTELKSMIATVLNLLEDQHILHEIPLELAHLLKIEPPLPKSTNISHDVAGFVKHLFDRL
ncbi:hypothetical protein JCM5350_007237 [Sporobolomyces pararoseus]